MLFFFALSSLINGISAIFFGLLVFLKNKKNIINQTFGLMSLGVCIWSFSYWKWLLINDLNAALFWSRLLNFGATLIPIFTLHWIFSLLNLNQKKKKILVAGYLMTSVFVLFSFTPLYIKSVKPVLFFPYWPQAGPLYICFIFLGYFGLVGYGFYQLLGTRFQVSGYKRTQINYVILGLIVGFGGGSTNFPLMFGVSLLPPIGNPFVSLYPLILAYAILRYRLMDINIALKKTMVYSLSAGILTSFFVVIVLTMTKYLSNLAGITSFTITIIAALIIALLFNPLRNRIQSIIDKIFYKKTYDYYSTIQKVSHELVSTFNLRKIYNFVGDTIFSTLGLKNIYLLSTVPGESYRMVYSTSYEKEKTTKDKEAINPIRKDAPPEFSNGVKIDRDSEVVKLLETFNDVFIREELPHIGKISQEVIDNVNTDLKPFKGEAVVPAFIDGKLELLMVLGEKLSGDIFTDEDIKLLNTISDQTAIAIKNARLYEEKLCSERLASIGMMSATFAHEVKNPLASIKTFAQLFPERYSDIDFRENFSKIVMDSVNHIDGLITDLMGLSSKRISSEMSTLNITGLIDQIIDEIRANLELEKKKIKIEKDYKDIKIDVFGDEKRLRQAFINIITNGCQAIPDGRDDGTLRIGINQDNENVDILITDNGDGIPVDDLPKIFEPFFSKKTIGSGLGLAITKKLIEDHSGKIEVESRLKKGTTFKITLPKETWEKGETLSTT